MFIETIATFFIITLLATLIPGPTMLYIASCGLSQGTKGYMAAGCGVLIADFIYFIITITGLSAILLASYELFSLIKLLGVAYLIYLGVRLIYSSNLITLSENSGLTKYYSFRAVFIRGFLIHLANPKTILFFSALLPQFINTEEPVLIQFLVIGAVLIFTQAVALIVYGSMANIVRRFVNKSQSSKKINVGSGIVLIVAGMWLATIRKSHIS